MTWSYQIVPTRPRTVKRILSSRLGAKHGVRTVQDFDAAIQQGKIREGEGFEDFFSFDRLEAERDKILEALNSLP